MSISFRSGSLLNGATWDRARRPAGVFAQNADSMQLSSRIVKLILTGNRQTSARQYSAAEHSYLVAFDEAEKESPFVAGVICITLGNNCMRVGMSEAGSRYYERAIHYLSGLKGQAILENGYANWNLAFYFMGRDDPAAVKYAETAVQIFGAHPYASEVDLADAVALLVSAQALTLGSADECELKRSWQIIKEVPFQKLRRHSRDQFLAVFLQAMQLIDRDRYLHIVTELRGWAGGAQAKRVLRNIAQGSQNLKRSSGHDPKPGN